MPRTAAVAVCLALGVAPAAAQSAAVWQMHGLWMSATRSFVGGGMGLALRDAGGEQLGLSVSAGSRDSAVAARGELLAAFYLDANRRRGVTPYATAGIAVVAARGGWEEDLVVGVGLESRPGTGTGWFIEAGVGGGIRGMIGLRWRHRR